MITKQFEMRDYQIIGRLGFSNAVVSIDAVCQFLYKGFLVSMSTMGLSMGACQSEVYIYAKDPEAAGDDKYTVMSGTFFTVQDAIEFINGLNGATVVKEAHDCHQEANDQEHILA